MRDTSKDKKDWLKILAVQFPRAWKLVQHFTWSRRSTNEKLIHRAIMEIAPRPNPLSCGWPYTTWEGLTNSRWSGRHLPPKQQRSNLPSPEAVAETLFAREGKMIPSEKSTLLFPYFAQWFTDGFLAADQVDRRCNFSRHEIDLSQLYGFHPETADLLREKQGGRLKSQQIDGAEFPPFIFGDAGEFKSEFRRRRVTFDDFVKIGSQPLSVEQSPFGIGPQMRENPLKTPNYESYEESPIPEHPNISPKIPSHLLYNELRLANPPNRPNEFETDAEFESRCRSWFAMGNDRANSTPAFVMMNVLMLREHNRIAALLHQEYPSWDDERLFQTTRNILTVIVLRIVIEEYINHITPYHFKIFVDPPRFFKAAPWKWTNRMNVEFNLLYRWHGMIPDELHLGDRIVPSAETLWNPNLVVKEGLAQMFNHASRQTAGRIGVKNTWSFLVKWAEIPSIAMAREAEVTTYNDYRELCGMPRVTRFEQISGDQSVVNALKDLYSSPDEVEFYAGIFSEDLRPNSALAPLMGTMVAADAFSQALTNPLLQPRTYTAETFSSLGKKIISETQTIEALVKRNTPEYQGLYDISMTRSDWKHS